MANKKRLIDANALLAMFEKEYKQSTYPYFHMDEIADEIIKAPTVDAVEVVRCKDYKWYAPNNDGCWVGCAFDTRHPDDVPKAEDYCSYGERKDNG